MTHAHCELMFAPPCIRIISRFACTNGEPGNTRWHVDLVADTRMWNDSTEIPSLHGRYATSLRLSIKRERRKTVVTAS